jgi:hypothetical protein
MLEEQGSWRERERAGLPGLGDDVVVVTVVLFWCGISEVGGVDVEGDGNVC